MVATSATASSVWWSRISMRPPRAGDPERRGGQRVQQVGTSLCLPVLVVRHPQRFPLGGLPAVWWSLEPRSQLLSIDTHRSSKLSNLGHHSDSFEPAAGLDSRNHS